MEIGNIRAVNINDEMRDSYLDYAMSVIVQRALPDVRDGMKPSQRRILHSMNENNNRFNASYKKCARIVGDVMGKYHPHGDSSVYDTLVRMAQDFSMRYMLVDGQGNFGSMDGDPPAAQRYTEARMAQIADEMLADIDKNTVDFRPNYDGSEREPNVLPAKLPNLLLNGSQGIAVGMATNIAPHNLSELCDAITFLIDNPDATVDDLLGFVPGPDFPMGGIIMGREGIREAYGTGKGRVVLRSKSFIEEGRNNRFSIITTEFPYGVNKAALQEKIAELVKEDKLIGISDMRDESDRTGVRLVIELKRDAQPQKVLNALYKYTSMQTAFSINMLALVDGSLPRVLTLKQILQHYIDWRHEVLTRRTKFELEKAKARAHILEGLLKLLDQLDAVIAAIRAERTTEAARSSLIQNFAFSEAQANAILAFQLGRLAALEAQKITDEYNELQRTIARLQALLDNPAMIFPLIKKDLSDLREKFGDARRTRIVDESGEDMNIEDLIADTKVFVTITNRGYIKRVPLDTYKRQNRGGRGINGMNMREQDVIEHTILCGTHDSLLFFTNKGRVFQLKTHEIPETGRVAKGLPLINLISLNQNELVTSVLPIRDFTRAEYLTMGTRLGKIKRTNLSEFAAVRANGLIAISLEDGDELGFVRETRPRDEIIMTSMQGKSLRFTSEDVRAMGRTAIGVNAMRLGDTKDQIVGMEIVSEGADLLIISEKGLGKRTPVNEYPTYGRGMGGVKTMNITERTGPIVATRIVRGSEDVIIMANSGMTIRIAVQDISQLGRAAQGVTVMNVRDGDGVANVAVIDDSGATETTTGTGNGNGGGEPSAMRVVEEATGRASGPATTEEIASADDTLLDNPDMLDDEDEK